MYFAASSPERGALLLGLRERGRMVVVLGDLGRLASRFGQQFVRGCHRQGGVKLSASLG
jgi:hypothetical protein